MTIMIPFLFFGALMTQLLPVSTYQSLEDVDYKNSEESAELIQMVIRDETDKVA